MSRKVIAFDLDDTLVVTKSPLNDRMSGLLVQLLEKYEVCVISGGTFEIFMQNVIERLPAEPEQLAKLHIMPTCGTRYYRYDIAKQAWALQYANDLTKEQKRRITEALEIVAKEMKIWHDNPKGEIIEDRLSQVTHSALGQLATPAEKYAWAEKNKNLRPIFRDKVAKRLPDLEVRIGGATSTDITLPGVDKAYGMEKLIQARGLKKQDILFIGDKLDEGGNDYPVKAMGIDSIEVERWEDTAYIVEGILGVSV